jgi:predicted phosphate transport protein (TIGR00153 family)
MFLPKKSKIIELLGQHAHLVKEAAQILLAVARDWKTLNSSCQKIRELEHQADELVHLISDEIERTFILPFDKDDLRNLVEQSDDIIDNIEEVVTLLNIYDITKGNAFITEFTSLLKQAAVLIHNNVLLINQQKLLSDEFVASYKNLHDLESEGDSLHRKILKELFSGKSSTFKNDDLLEIIKWKEIFQTLENSMDRCEDIAITFEKLKVKYR